MLSNIVRYYINNYRNWGRILTHWGPVTYICVSKLTIIGSDNGLSPGRRQAIIWINAGILSIGPLGTYFSEIYIEILTFSFKEMRLKVSSAKWQPFCLGLNVLIRRWIQAIIWTNSGILLIGILGTNFSEILIKVHKSWFKVMHLKMLSAKFQPSCLGLTVLIGLNHHIPN